MSEKCELRDDCPFSLRWNGNTESEVQAGMSDFCNDKAKSEACARKVVSNATGKPPADNFSPTGELIL